MLRALYLSRCVWITPLPLLLLFLFSFPFFLPSFPLSKQPLQIATDHANSAPISTTATFMSLSPPNNPSLTYNFNKGNHKGLFMNEVLLAFVDSNGKSHKITISGDFATTSKTNDRFCSPQMLKAGVACLRGIRVEMGSEGKSLNITSPTEVSIGEDAKLTISNNPCPFENRAGPCNKFHAKIGGYGLVSLRTPSIDIDVGTQFMNAGQKGTKSRAKALHHLDLTVTKYYPSGDAKGMLGQTTHVRLDHLGNPIMKGPSSIAGVEEDYIISALDTSALSSDITLRNTGGGDHPSSFSAFIDGDEANP